MRNPPPPSDSGPYQDPYSPYGHPERPYQAPHTAQAFSYPHLPHHERGPHGTYTALPPPPQPYTSQRDLIRMSSAPLDVSQPSAGPANSLYHPEASARDRYPPEGYYPAQPPPMRPYARVSPQQLPTWVESCMAAKENSVSARFSWCCLSGATVQRFSAQPGLPAQASTGAVVSTRGEESHLPATVCPASLLQRLPSRRECAFSMT